MDLQIIVTKNEKDLTDSEKTELRRNIRNLTIDQKRKFVQILSQSDPNIGEQELIEDNIGPNPIEKE